MLIQSYPESEPAGFQVSLKKINFLCFSSCAAQEFSYVVSMNLKLNAA